MPLTLPWPLGRTCRGASGLPWPSHGHPRAWAVLVVLTLRGSPLAPTPKAGIDRPDLPLSYVAYVCFKCFRRFRYMMQLFHLDVVKIDRGLLHMLHMLQVFFRGMLQMFVQNISSIFRCMLQSFFIWILLF
jgi:hypothetical protein